MNRHRRNSCNIFIMPGQSKAEAIRTMIETKTKKELEKKLIVETTKKFKKELSSVNRLKEKKKKIETEINNFEKELEKIAIEYKLRYSQGCFYLSCNQCYVPEKVTRKLQEAINLSALGKKKDANNIYESLIKEYKLL